MAGPSVVPGGDLWTIEAESGQPISLFLGIWTTLQSPLAFICHTVSIVLGEKVPEMSPLLLLVIWDMEKEGKRTGKGEKEDSRER